MLPAMYRRPLGALAIAALTVVAGTGVLVGSGNTVEPIVLLGGVLGVAYLIVADSEARGRAGWGWLALCFLLAPFAIPVFLFLAVRDRLQGRRGIEARWDPARRWYLLAGVVLAVAAVVVALGPIHVASVTVTSGDPTSGYTSSSTISGSCTSALDVVTGNDDYGQDSAGQSAAVAAANLTLERRCSTQALRRMTAGAVGLAGAFLLALVGGGIVGRRKPAPYPESSLVA